MNKPVESTKTEAICNDENTDGSRRDEDGYNVDTNKKEMVDADYIAANMFTSSGNYRYRTIHEVPDDEPVTTGRFNKVFTDWRSYLLEQDERVGTIVAWNWILFIIVFGLLIYLLIKTF